MAINETIVTGRKFRKCIDAVNKTWQRISFWTKSSDVEFEDGKNAETKLGAIDGITDSLVDTSSRMAASAKAVSTLNNNLGGFRFYEENGNKYVVGADSVPKKLGSLTIKKQTVSSGRLAGTTSYTAVFSHLNNVTAVTACNVRVYMSSGIIDANSVSTSFSISGNKVTVNYPYALTTYQEVTVSAIEVVG